MQPADLEPGPCIYFYFDRYRGNFNRSRHVFVIYEEDGIKHWWCEVPEYAATPEQLMERIAEHEAPKRTSITFFAAGIMSESEINFTVLRDSAEDIRQFIAIAFGAPQNARCLLYRYESSKVSLQSQDPGRGSVGTVLESCGLSIARLSYA